MVEKTLVEMTLILNNFIVVLVLLGHVDAQGGCAPEVRVHKNTVFRVSRKSPLNIFCPVKYCEEVPTVQWFRVANTSYNIPVRETDQITVTQGRSTAHEKEIISYLSFKSISNTDDGFYRCVASVSNSSSQSHNINISISDTVLEPVNETTLPPTDRPLAFEWMPYLLICSGIISLVIIVMLIFFLSTKGCKDSRKSNTQRTQVPPSPNVTRFDGQHRGQDKSDQRKNVLNLSAETLQFDTTPGYPAMGQENTQQQEIVYATLEHLTPRELSAINHHSREQHSEYASIRYTETV